MGKSYIGMNTWDLEYSLGFRLVRTARVMKHALDAKLTDVGLTATQYIVLARLWTEDGISLTELGDHLSLDSPTLTGIIDRMERDGLVERKRNDGDRRVVRVYLTPKGTELEQTIGTFAADTDNEAWRNFTDSERDEVLRSLDVIWNTFND